MNHPPPWSLSGTAFILLYRLPEHVALDRSALPGDMTRRYVGGTSALMLVDYERSEVGPHQEAFFVPGRFRRGEETFFAMSRIVSSSVRAQEAGRRHWGLPKESAQLRFEQRGRREIIRLSREGVGCATFRLEVGLMGLPVMTDVIPESRRTLMQQCDGKTFYTTPSGRGTLKRASLEGCEMEGDLLPDLSAHQPVMVVKADPFQLQLPHPRVEATHCLRTT